MRILSCFDTCDIDYNVYGVQRSIPNGSRHVIVLSHWPHVATHIATQVAQLVSENVAGTVHTGHIVEQQVGTHF